MSSPFCFAFRAEFGTPNDVGEFLKQPLAVRRYEHPESMTSAASCELDLHGGMKVGLRFLNNQDLTGFDHVAKIKSSSETMDEAFIRGRSLFLRSADR